MCAYPAERTISKTRFLTVMMMMIIIVPTNHYIYSELTQKRISTAKTARDTQKTKTAGKLYMPTNLDILISEP